MSPPERPKPQLGQTVAEALTFIAIQAKGCAAAWILLLKDGVEYANDKVIHKRSNKWDDVIADIKTTVSDIVTQSLKKPPTPPHKH